MKETLLDLWVWLVLIVGCGFVLVLLLQELFPGLFPNDDEPTYYWEIND